MSDEDVLLTTAELAKLRGCSASKINKERLTGDGVPFIRDGVSVRYHLRDYRAWVAQQPRVMSTSEMVAA